MFSVCRHPKIAKNGIENSFDATLFSCDSERDTDLKHRPIERVHNLLCLILGEFACRIATKANLTSIKGIHMKEHWNQILK